MPEPFDSATLAALVSAHIPTDPARLRIAPIGTGKHNSSYWVNSDGERWVLRVAPRDDAGFLFYERRMMRQEPELHALLHAHTSIPLAKIVAYDFSRTRIDRDYLLMTALPGVPLSDAHDLTGAQLARALRQLGDYLRRLHALTALACLGEQSYGYLGAHRPMEPQPTWASAFSVMWNKLLDDVVASGCYTDHEAQRLRDLLERHWAHFDRPVVSRLLHMDVWSQNILIDSDGNVTGLVDFDRALWGDVEIEFAVLDYCGMSEPPFWAGYRSPRDESPSAQIRRQFYLLYEVQKYMPISVWRGNDLVGALNYKRHSLALAARLGFRR
jgi:aminoglycoside phosphotransferase (APT) family kinase protein